MYIIFYIGKYGLIIICECEYTYINNLMDHSVISLYWY